jgi:hypothetical protein
MPEKHRSKESVKAYLLGNLDEGEACALEQVYFSDPAFLEWIGIVEGELIAAYLQGQLSQAEMAQFEFRYLEIPALKKKVDAARSGPAKSARTPSRAGWRYALAAVLVAGCVVFAWMWAKNHGAQQIARETPPPIVLAVHLTPGLTKGEGAAQVAFVAPLGGKVRLSFELPGLRAPVECQVRVAIVDAGGRRNIVWSSGRVETQASGASQEARVDIDSANLPFGDYVGEVLAPDGTVQETYSFRVNRSEASK